MSQTTNTKSEYFINMIKEVSDYFAISNECASYLLFRARYSNLNPTKLTFTIPLQNLIVYADKCLDVNWSNMVFGEEFEYLAHYSINPEQTQVCTWREEVNEVDADSPAADTNDGWTSVAPKKNKKQRAASKKKILTTSFTKFGIFI